MKNHHQILGLTENATIDEVKAAYRKYASKLHPDKHQEDEFFKERFQEIQEAYNILISQLSEKEDIDESEEEDNEWSEENKWEEQRRILDEELLDYLVKDNNYSNLQKKRRQLTIRQNLLSTILVIILCLIASIILYWLVVILPPTNMPTAIYALLLLGTPILIGLLGIPLKYIVINTLGGGMYGVYVLEEYIRNYETGIKLNIAGFAYKDYNVDEYEMLSEELKELIFVSKSVWIQFLQNEKQERK